MKKVVAVVLVVLMLVGTVGFAQTKQELIDELMGILNTEEEGESIHVKSQYYEDMDCLCIKYKLTGISTSDYNSLDTASKESLVATIQTMCVHPYEALQSFEGICDDTTFLAVCMTSNAGMIKVYLNDEDVSWLLKE